MTHEDALARERIRSLGTRDWFLQQLVRLSNERPEDHGFLVTLCVKGIIVSGVLTSGRAYFSEFAQNERIPPALREYCAAFGELYAPHPQDAAGDSATADILAALPEFIHLRDAHIVGGTDSTPPASRDGVWWRGRIAEIDGFVLGDLTPFARSVDPAGRRDPL